MFGYLLGILFSIVAVILIWICIAAGAAQSAVSLGGSRRFSCIAPLLVFGSYLAVAMLLALFSHWIFNSDLTIAFLLNISPPVVLISLVFLLNKYRDYVQRRKNMLNAQNAIDDAPYIHLEAPFVKKVQKQNGGVIMFLHVPFTVTKTVRAKSVMFLAPLRLSKNIKYSSTLHCNNGYEIPTYGFHLVNREYTESPLPIHVSGIEIVSEELQPDKRYYLLRELHFDHSSCRISDFDDFDLQQLNIKLSTSRAELTLIDGIIP